MKNILLTCFLLAATSIDSFGQKNNYQSLKQMDWLAGYWQGTYQGGPFYEAWIKVNDSLFVNLGIEIKNNDTLVKENGFIRLQNGNITHGGGKDTWQLAELTDTKMVFENGALNYANKITWSHSTNDHWLTEIHNPKSIINYELVRIAWLKQVVDDFIRKAKRG